MGRRIEREKEKKERRWKERETEFRAKRNGQQRGSTKRLKRVVKVREGRGER